MRARAPGKLVLTGAYAVLDGAPAIVAAVDRYAFADTSRVSDRPAPEVRAAVPEGEPVPEVDATALHDEAGRKLGLGSSAAVLVASLAARACARGEDLRDPAVRAGLFRAARAAHALAQGGGSGADVAASIYGGMLRYSVSSSQPDIRPVALPRDLVLRVYFGGSSARTSDLLKRVSSMRVDRSRELSPLMSEMVDTATLAADAIESGNTSRFVALAREYGALLASLGQVTSAPIVLPAHAELASSAEREDAAFLPSGAGGGDVAVWLGRAAPSREFDACARALALSALALSIDLDGVRQESAYN